MAMASAARVAMRRERLLDDVAERCPFPALAGQHVMRLGERKQPGFEGFARLRRRLARLEALRRDRLHGRERVLHPVIELVDEELLRLFMSALLGAVAEDLEEAAAMVSERQHDAAAPEPRAVLAQMPALVRGPAFRARQRHLASRLAGGAVLGGEEDVARAADHVGFVIAEDALGTGVPGRDPAVRVEGEDRVFPGALEDQAEPLLRVAMRPLGGAAFDDRLSQLTRDLVDLGEAGLDETGVVRIGRRPGERSDRPGDAARDPEGEAEAEHEEGDAEENGHHQRLPERRGELLLGQPDADAPAGRLGAAEGGEGGNALMGLREDDALVPGDQMWIERRRGALADEPF